MKEADLQRAVLDYLKYQMNLGKLWFTRLNSGMAYKKHGNKYYAIKLCDKGTADILVIYPTAEGPTVLFLELKSEKGKLTKEQFEFSGMAWRMGCEYHVIRTIERLEEILSK